jgi:hypothetical protein
MPTDQPLFSVWGDVASGMYAVGGNDMGVIVKSNGQRWSEIAQLQTGAGLSGVFTSANGPTVAVGPNYIVEIARDGSLVEPRLPALESGTALHGVWGDDHGTTYAVGGTLYAYPGVMDGVILSRR